MANFELVLVGERLPHPVYSRGGRFLGSQDRGWAECSQCGAKKPLIAWQINKARGDGLDVGDLGECKCASNGN